MVSITTYCRERGFGNERGSASGDYADDEMDKSIEIYLVPSDNTRVEWQGVSGSQLSQTLPLGRPE
jgi:hypothetical protein